MPASDLPLLIEAAQAAGELALGFTGPEARRWDKPEGAGPVTEADLAVNRLLEDRLRAARPDYGWLSEESDEDPERQSRACTFIIDPIDGTRSFAEGSGVWAHSIAVAERGEVTAGVIFLPRMEMLFSAARGKGASLNGAPIAPSNRSGLEGAEILATKPNMRPEHWTGGAVPGFRRSHRPSLAYRMALVAQGKYDAMITLRPCWEWDIAAGELIAREAGAHVTDRTGGRLRFNNPHPAVNGVLAANAGLHDEILTALAPEAAAP